MPRAVSLDGEGMRLFQTMGLAETLLPKLGISRNIRHVNSEGKLLLLIARGGIGPDGWNHAYRFFQPELEGVLRHGVERFKTLKSGCAAMRSRFDERDDDVQVRYENLSNGELASLTARYVVGCDGARSTVRRFMGSALQDLRSHERWIVLDMILDTPPAGVPEAAHEMGEIVDSIQYCDPARPTTFIPMPGKRYRWEFMLMPGDDPVKVVQPDSIYNLLKPWKIEPVASHIERAVVYTFHSSLATKWRNGRLLLAGRFGAPDATVPGPRHVLRLAGRRESRVETARCSSGPRARYAARQLRDRAYGTCSRIYRTRCRTRRRNPGDRSCESARA